MRYSPLLVCCLAMAACGPESGSGFLLQLRPVLPDSHSTLFDKVQALRLVAIPPTGDPLEWDLTPPSSGASAIIEDVSLLDAGTTFRLEGYSSEAPTASALVAVGYTGPLDMEPGEEADLNMAVVSPTDMMTFYTMASEKSGAPVISDGQGSFYIFGGTAGGWGNDPAGDEILRWSLMPPGDGFPFEEIGSLPQTEDPWWDEVEDEPISGRSDATAVRLLGEHNGGRILLTGGWEDYLDGFSITGQALLFDPEDHSVEAVADLLVPRAMHVAVPLSSGDVIIFHGFTRSQGADRSSATFNGVAEIFDSRNQKFVYAESPLYTYAAHGAAAPLNSDEAMYCGGLDRTGTSTSSGGVATCTSVERFGRVQERPPVPIGTGDGVVFPSMVQLDDGDILLAGGAITDGFLTSGYWPATNRAWRYDTDSDTWTEVGSMPTPRAHFAMAVLPSGEVIAAGGAAEISYSGQNWDGALSCVDIFNPDADTWRPLTSGCTAPGHSGPLPVPMVGAGIAVDPSYGALVFGGLDDSRRSLAHFALFSGAPAL